MEQRIVLQPLAKISDRLLEMLQRSLLPVFGRPVVVRMPPAVTLDPAFAPRRKQYLAALLLSGLRDPGVTPAERCLGIVDVDLYSPGVQYVFGHADASLGTAVVSLFRMKQERYGLPRNDQLLAQRVIKEAVHELGHTYYLSHCSDLHCVMHVCHSLAEADKREPVFCPRCKQRLVEAEV